MTLLQVLNEAAGVPAQPVDDLGEQLLPGGDAVAFVDVDTSAYLGRSSVASILTRNGLVAIEPDRTAVA